ncbi:hypothetical protein BH18VER1_BH18VER1_09710 [soil metagenome]
MWSGASSATRFHGAFSASPLPEAAAEGDAGEPILASSVAQTCFQPFVSERNQHSSEAPSPVRGTGLQDRCCVMFGTNCGVSKTSSRGCDNQNHGKTFGADTPCARVEKRITRPHKDQQKANENPRTCQPNQTESSGSQHMLPRDDEKYPGVAELQAVSRINTRCQPSAVSH